MKRFLTCFVVLMIAMFVGVQLGRWLVCEQAYQSEGRPDVTYRNGVLLWHPWEIVPAYDIEKYRRKP